MLTVFNNFVVKLIIIKSIFNFFFLVDMGSILNILFFIKNSSNFICKYLIDVTSFDNVGFKFRFKISYNLSSLNLKKVVFIYSSIFLLTQIVSINNLFLSSIWMEREIFDLFGIFFLNNWDLRKILTDYTFFGFPLRKDFPLSGFLEVIFNDSLKSIFEVAIELMQEFRFFLTASASEFWEDLFGFKL